VRFNVTIAARPVTVFALSGAEFTGSPTRWRVLPT